MSPVADCNLYAFYTRATEFPGARATLRSFFGCLCSAVNYLHSNKIRHRDIKPENILVKGQNIYLADFGISLDWANLSKSTTSTDSSKTPAYCALEVANHQKRNSSSDIWSLGCVFLETSTILKGRQLAQMRQHFKTHSDVWAFHKNLPAIREWSNALTSGGSKVDNHPLEWTRSMLQVQPELRPSAEQLFHWASKTNPDPNSQKRPFCTSCCIFHDDEDSDVGSLSDGEFWNENTDERAAPLALTNGVLNAASIASTNSHEAIYIDRAPASDDPLGESYSRSAPHPVHVFAARKDTESRELTAGQLQKELPPTPDLSAEMLTTSTPPSEEESNISGALRPTSMASSKLLERSTPYDNVESAPSECNEEKATGSGPPRFAQSPSSIVPTRKLLTPTKPSEPPLAYQDGNVDLTDLNWLHAERIDPGATFSALTKLGDFDRRND